MVRTRLVGKQSANGFEGVPTASAPSMDFTDQSMAEFGNPSEPHGEAKRVAVPASPAAEPHGEAKRVAVPASPAAEGVAKAKTKTRKHASKTQKGGRASLRPNRKYTPLKKAKDFGLVPRVKTPFALFLAKHGHSVRSGSALPGFGSSST